MAQAARVTDTLNEYTVVDTDVHLSIDPKRLIPYLDEPHKGHAKVGVKPTDNWNRSRGGMIKTDDVVTATDIEEGLCDQFSIDYPIINPTSPFLNGLPQPDLADALMVAYNDYVIDEFLDRNDDFYGAIQIATHHPDKAAEEIDRLGGESQVCGVYIVTLGSERPLGDERYDVIYEAAEDNDLGIAYHSGTNAFPVDFPRHNVGFNSFLPIHTLGHPWGQMQTLVSLICEGTPEKFPDLNFVFLEAGISWVPFLMFRLNKEYSIRKDEAPLLTKQPEEYIRDFYFATQPLGEPMDRSHMAMMMDIIDAPNTLAFSTDYPHWDFDNPSELFGYIRSKYDEADIERILSGNAIEAFNLPL